MKASGDYGAVRAHLVKTIPWLNFFDRSLDGDIQNALGAVANNPPRYDCYQLEDLIKDVSQSLDRCLVYRREYNQLEGTAIKTALDYELFKRTLASNYGLETAAWVEQQRSAENKAQIRAEQAFGAGDPLARGFGAIAHGSADSSQIAVTGEQSRKAMVADKWSALSDYQATLEDQHNTLGHPLNFSDQASKAESFLLDDLQEVYEKCRCIERGVTIVYGLNAIPPLPNYRVAGVLDNLILWIRELIRQIELATFDDIDFEHVVSGQQPSQGANKVYQIVTSPNFGTAIAPNGSGRFDFDVRQAFVDIGPIANLRVRGVGMSIGYTQDAGLADAKLVRTSAAVFPPDIADPFNRANFVKRSPILLENLALTEPQERVRFYNPSSVTNIDPRGIWTVQLSTNHLGS